MRSILFSSALLLTSSLAALACSDPVAPPGGSGGTGSGGVGSGGAPGGSGGAVGSGGALGSGGASTSGGASSGGGTSSGGASSGGGTSSGGASSGGASSGGGTGSGGDSGGEFTLTSAGLEEGMPFDPANTCEGGGGTFGFGLALPFEWSGAPAETTHYAMVMLDNYLVGMDDRLGYHSAFWNLPASVTSLPAEFGAGDLTGAELINGGYLGPCPGGTEHTYTFTLYALDAEITLSTSAFNMLTTAEEFVAALEEAAIDKATLTGSSDAQM